MERRLYQTGQFARRACVSLRTLRYYDKVGLLSPSAYTEAGYRLYTEQDLLALQHILALKFLGFSLEEIKQCLGSGPRRIGVMLARQRKMLQAKRRQLDAVLRAIDSAEKLVASDQCDEEAILRVIEVIQMQQKQEWVKNYFNDEQLQKMQELGQASYSEAARQKLAQRGPWTEEDQQRANAQWAWVASEAERLAAAGADPAREEAQALAKLKSDLLFSFTQGDSDIEAGLAKFWENHNALPEEEQPLASMVPSSVVPGAKNAGTQLLEEAMTIYRERQQTLPRDS